LLPLERWCGRVFIPVLLLPSPLDSAVHQHMNEQSGHKGLVSVANAEAGSSRGCRRSPSRTRSAGLWARFDRIVKLVGSASRHMDCLLELRNRHWVTLRKQGPQRDCWVRAASLPADASSSRAQCCTEYKTCPIGGNAVGCVLTVVPSALLGRGGRRGLAVLLKGM
jgi:hypothetical protein